MKGKCILYLGILLATRGFAAEQEPCQECIACAQNLYDLSDTIQDYRIKLKESLSAFLNNDPNTPYSLQEWNVFALRLVKQAVPALHDLQNQLNMCINSAIPYVTYEDECVAHTIKTVITKWRNFFYLIEPVKYIPPTDRSRPRNCADLLEAIRSLIPPLDFSETLIQFCHSEYAEDEWLFYDDEHTLTFLCFLVNYASFYNRVVRCLNNISILFEQADTSERACAFCPTCASARISEAIGEVRNAYYNLYDILSTNITLLKEKQANMLKEGPLREIRLARSFVLKTQDGSNVGIIPDDPNFTLLVEDSSGNFLLPIKGSTSWNPQANKEETSLIFVVIETERNNADQLVIRSPSELKGLKAPQRLTISFTALYDYVNQEMNLSHTLSDTTAKAFLPHSAQTNRSHISTDKHSEDAG